MTRLEKKLQEFTKNGLTEEERKTILSSNDAPQSFKEIAQEILSGYFAVKTLDRERKIIPTMVEFYYHEESGEIKDYIVYHRNSKKENTENKPKPLFQIGVLHNHVSGIDITFEHEAHNTICRASALIRAFKVDNDEKIEERSTQLYEYLFSQIDIFRGISVQWQNGIVVDENGIKAFVRKNVAEYDENEKKLEKQDGKVLTKDGRHVQCQRQWQFSVRNE